MQLKSLLREYLEVKGRAAVPRFDFLPSYKSELELPIEPAEVPWSMTDESERVIHFDRRSDLQDFVNAYIELEEEFAIYVPLTIDGLIVKVNSNSSLDRKFKETIDEIARETRGH